MEPYRKIQLVEADNVSVVWKVFHIITLIGAAFFGITGGISLSILYKDESFLCGSPSLIATSISMTAPHSAYINGSYINLNVIYSGGADDACDYSQYALITSFIFASIWGMFFIICDKGGKSENELPQPWRIVLPALIFSTIFSFISLGAGTQTTMAIDHFCSTFNEEFDRILNETYVVKEKCRDLNQFLQVFPMDSIHVQTIMRLAEAMAWLCFVSWLCFAGLCLLRILTGPDFRPVFLPVSETESPRVLEREGYKSFKNTPGSSLASSSGQSSEAGFSGTSQAVIHEVSQKDESCQTRRRVRFITGQQEQLGSDKIKDASIPVTGTRALVHQPPPTAINSAAPQAPEDTEIILEAPPAKNIA